MTDKEFIAAALKYNKGRGYSDEQIKLIQSVVGAEADGRWGPKTTTAVFQWQKREQLTSDGRVGPATIMAIRDTDLGATPVTRPDLPASVKPHHMELGVWVDDPPTKVLTTQWFSALTELGFNFAAIMLDTSSKPWDSVWTPAQLERAAEFATDHGVKLGLTVWPFPDRGLIDQMMDEVEVLMRIAPEIYKELESDAEFNWVDKYRRGFSSMDDAAMYLTARKNKATMSGARIAMSTFTAHTENGRGATLAPRMERLNVQAYSKATRKRSDGSLYQVPYSHTYGPGHMQKHTLDRTTQVRGVSEGRIKLGCGIGAWDQKFPGHTPQQAMMDAYKGALNYESGGVRVCELRVWSSKHVFGVRKNRYAANFFRSLLPQR